MRTLVRSRRFWLGATLATIPTLVMDVRPVLEGAHSGPSGSSTPPLIAASAQSSQAMIVLAGPTPPVTRIDPRFEVCSNPELGRVVSRDAAPSAEMSAYWQRQEQDLMEAAIMRLLDPGSSDAQRVAGLILQGDVAAAAQVAASGEDGFIYGMAWRACHTELETGPSAACGLLTIDRWAQLEPNNMAPWLAGLSVALRRGDYAQAVNAMHRAGLSSEVEGGWGWLTAKVTEVLPAELPESGELRLLAMIASRQAQMISVRTDGLVDYCRVEALPDANTRQQCERVARLLMLHSRSLVEMAAGVTVAERLALDPESMPVSRAQLRAAARWAEGMDELADCEGSRLLIAHLRDSARLGELQAVSSAIKRQRDSFP